MFSTSSVNTNEYRPGSIKNRSSSGNGYGGSASSALKYAYTKMARSNESFQDIDDITVVDRGYYHSPPKPAKQQQIMRPHVLEVNKYDVEFGDGNPLGSTTASSGTPLKRSNGSTSSSATTVLTPGGGLPSPTSTPSHKSQSSLSSKKPEKPRSGPSSRRTVLVIAGFFVVGTIFVISGIIVLCTQRHPAFDTAGAVFVAVGAVSYVVCLFLQQKNVKKLMRDLEQDLYFLNIPKNPLLRTFFSFDGNTATNGGAAYQHARALPNL